MEKKFKFSDNPSMAKAIYGAVIALLCITAIVIGIVAANNRKAPTEDVPPPVDEGNGETNTGTGTEGDGEGEGEGEGEKEDEKPTLFIAPVSGSVAKQHSTSIPVYSETLEAWKIHTGIDITTDDGADVFCVADGEVTKVYSSAMLGNTVEITHKNGVKTVYSNLSGENLVTVGTKLDSGAKIGCVGDSAISELADEPHLHFEVIVNEASVNPLDYISEDAKRTSLGISEESAA